MSSSGLRFATRRGSEHGKKQARKYVLDLLRRVERRGCLVSMPGIGWELESAALEAGWEVLSVEREPTIYSLSSRLLGDDYVVEPFGVAPYGRRYNGGLHYIMGTVEEVMFTASPAVIWADFSGPITPFRMSAVRSCVSRKTLSAVIVTAMRGRSEIGPNEVKSVLTDAGMRIEHELCYRDSSAMFQIAASRPDRLLGYGQQGKSGPQTLKPKNLTCASPGCVGPNISRGMCTAHLRRGPGAERRRYDPGAKCSVIGCTRTAAALGYCHAHHENRRVSGREPDGPVATDLMHLCWCGATVPNKRKRGPKRWCCSKECAYALWRSEHALRPGVRFVLVRGDRPRDRLLARLTRHRFRPKGRDTDPGTYGVKSKHSRHIVFWREGHLYKFQPKGSLVAP